MKRGRMEARCEARMAERGKLKEVLRFRVVVVFVVYAEEGLAERHPVRDDNEGFAQSDRRRSSSLHAALDHD